VSDPLSRRKFLSSTGAVAAIPAWWDLLRGTPRNSFSFGHGKAPSPGKTDHIFDMHVHFDEKNPNFISDFLRVSEKLNLTACLLTPFANRKVVADAAKQHPTQIIPFGFVDLDAPDVVKQVEELHAMGYRGLGEMEFVKRPYNDPSYLPVYELANGYGWIVLFHTGIVLRRKFDEPEDVASGRMRPIYLEEIARRFPKITVLGAHCGNPEYEWAAEIARWNPNVFWDLSGSTLTKMQGRLADFQKIFWWSNTEWQSPEWKAKKLDSDPSAFVKIVFGSDNGLDGIESVVNQYHALFEACGIPANTRKMIMGGTLSNMLGLPDGH
jgi:uncharacterized protein